MTEILLRNEPEDGVLVLTMNRPGARNALNLELVEAMADAPPVRASRCDDFHAPAAATACVSVHTSPPVPEPSC